MLIRFPFTGVLQRFGQDDAWKRSGEDVTQSFALGCTVQDIHIKLILLQCAVGPVFLPRHISVSLRVQQ